MAEKGSHHDQSPTEEHDGKYDEKQDHTEVVGADADTTAVLPAGSVDPVYQAKAKVLNDAIQAIGMGKYQVAPICSPIHSFPDT